MKTASAVLVVLAVMAAIACGNGKEEPAQDIDATVEAGVRATLQADAALGATVEAGIRATLQADAEVGATVEAGIRATVEARVAQEVRPPTPTSTQTPTPTREPAPTATPRPMPAVVPTPAPPPTPAPTPTLSPTATPQPTPPPEPSVTPSAPLTPQEEERRLEQYAARHAGGPGAIFVSDLAQLAGPAVTGDYRREHGRELGDDSGEVPLEAITENRWIFESDYYRSLLVKARLTNPAPLVSEGENITLEHLCVRPDSPWCHHLAIFFAENVAKRTNGQVTIDVYSYGALGFASVDGASLLKYGTLEMSEVNGGHVNTEFPLLGLPYLWGLWPDDQTHFEVIASILPDLEQLVEDHLESKILSLNWMPEDRFIFSRKRLDTPGEVKGLKTSSLSAEMSDWLDGIGSDYAYLHPAELHVALERDILEAAVDGSHLALERRWYEVTDYMYGPLYSFNASFNAINGEVWSGIPEDLQHILVEEAAKQELEALRLAAVQNTTGVQRNVDAGMEFVEFSPELRRQSSRAAMASVVPGWLRRVEYPLRGQQAVDVFNNKVAPYVGLRIEPDGTMSETPITQGPHAGDGSDEPPPLPEWPTPEDRPLLASYAAHNAGGPGTIYLGELAQLAGPAPTPDQGDTEGNVPLYALEEHRFVYESPYYQSVMKRARLIDPTPLSSKLETPIVIEHACLHRSLPMCRMFETYFVPNVERRTKGQVEIVPSSYSELGIATPDSVNMLRDDVLSMATIFIPPALPSLEIQGLQGLYIDRSQQFAATAGFLPEVERILAEATGGYPLIVNWDNGADLFIFAKKPLNAPADMRGLATRSFNHLVADWINGMGAEAKFWTLAETFNALERGIFDAGVTAGDAAHSRQWHRVTDYIHGPLISWPTMYSVVSAETWASLPPDLQEIMKGEAAKLELEALRVAAIQNVVGLQLNIDAGMTHVEFSPAMRAQNRVAVERQVLPEWIARVGGPGVPIIEVFNRTIAPIIGLTIEPDGTIADTG